MDNSTNGTILIPAQWARTPPSASWRFDAGRPPRRDRSPRGERGGDRRRSRTPPSRRYDDDRDKDRDHDRDRDRRDRRDRDRSRSPDDRDREMKDRDRGDEDRERDRERGGDRERDYERENGTNGEDRKGTQTANFDSMQIS